MRNGENCGNKEDRDVVRGVCGNHSLIHSVFVSLSRFVSVDLDEAMQRVEKRHVATGKPPNIAKWRVSFLP